MPAALLNLEPELRRRACVAICGGGTAGHVMTGVALAQAFQAVDPSLEIVFLGGFYGLEGRLLAATPFRLYTIASDPVARQSAGGGLGGLAMTAAGILAARELVGRLGVRLAVGVGGYASVPGMVAAWSRGIPSALIELNSDPGIANRLLGRLVDRVYVGPLAERQAFARAEVRRIGMPVRTDVTRPPPAGGLRGGAGRPVRVLVTGGSLGSTFLNREVPRMLERVAAGGLPLNVVHQTGREDRAQVDEEYRRARIPAAVHEYLDELPARLNASDFAITSSGALTLAELSALGIPCLLVPDPTAAGDHQTANARAFSRLTGCLVSDAARWNPDEIARQLVARLSEPLKLRSEIERMRALAPPGEAVQLVRGLVPLLGHRD